MTDAAWKADERAVHPVADLDHHRFLPNINDSAPEHFDQGIDFIAFSEGAATEMSIRSRATTGWPM